MKNSNQKIKVYLEKGSRNNIEYFVEEISDKLRINETYFGNLLTGMDALFLILTENQNNSTVYISYNTDYQEVKINIDGVSRETEAEILKSQEKAKENTSSIMFTLLNVTESVLIEDQRLTLVFDIGAMNRVEYQRRKQALEKYFNGEKTGKSIKSNDHFYL